MGYGGCITPSSRGTRVTERARLGPHDVRTLLTQRGHEESLELAQHTAILVEDPGPLADSRADGARESGLAREPHRDVDVLLRGVRNAIGNPELCVHRLSVTRALQRAGQRHDGQSHGERLERGVHAVEVDRVEADVA